MGIADAWRALGEDPEEVVREIRSCPDVPSRIAAAEAALSRAERIAKALMAAHHPDRNQGDSSAERRFKRVQAALESVRFHTGDLKSRASRTKDDPGDEGPKIVFG